MGGICDGGSTEAGGVVESGVLSGSSNTTSYSVINKENTGAGIFRVGEKTMPTNISNRKFMVYHSVLSSYFLGNIALFALDACS